MSEKTVVKGIVLRETQTKEADKILTVLTAEYGRISVIARGARRRGSKIAAGAQLFAFSEMVLYEQKNWWMLDEVSVLSLFDGIRQDVELLSLAAYFAELTEAVTAENMPCGEILSLLLNALYALDTLKKPQELVKAVFELRLLSLSGYEPLLDACAVCGAERAETPCFDVTEGVIFCKECAPAFGEHLPLDAASLAAMRFVLGGKREKLFSFRLEEEAMRRFSRACERFAAVQLERPFRTLDFYRSLSNFGEKQ